jgi:glycerol-3-phosphate dehydrogenase
MERFDVAVIGGGVVGLAILRALTLAGARAVLLERGRDILSGASKGNSALLHTGFDAPPHSLELATMTAGYREYLAIRERLNLPLLPTGAFVVAWNADEAAKLPGIVEKAQANGIAVERIGAAQLYRAEPNLAAGAFGAVHVPGEAVIDPWSAPLAYAWQALANGARIERSTLVRTGSFDGATWSLETSAGDVRAGVVVNAAGLFGDIVESIARPSPFTIKPRKGQFVVFDKAEADVTRAIVLPVPSERTKGVLIAPTAFGNILVGPTAEDQDDREDASVDAVRLAALIEKAHALVPALARYEVTAVYAGIRPATERKEYVLEALPERHWITAGGIRSTGLTSALGIARYVADLYAQHFGELAAPPEPIWTPVPNLCETLERPYERGGEIVCHCERVTRAEIEEALAGPLPAGDIGGLKRRTRCLMGRCQGFYCSARIAALAAGQIPHLSETLP